MSTQAQQTTSRHVGVVKWFNSAKGYGFIASETALPDKADVFVHFSGISARGYRTLVEGQEVEFSVEDGAKGPQAAAVTAIGGGELEDTRHYKNNKE